MLKGIPKVLTPEMLKILCEMGHDDEIVIADAHFPAEAMGKRVIQYPCISAPEMVEAIVKVMPLDTYVKAPIMVMSLVQSDIDKGMPIPTMWEEVRARSSEIEGFEVSLNMRVHKPVYEWELIGINARKASKR